MSAIETTTEGHVRTIILNRPEVKNALNDELSWGVISAVKDANDDDDIWVIAITGAGDAFCSGLDLRGPGESHNPRSPLTQQLDDLAWISEFPLVLRRQCEKPIVAGINGVAVGGGLSLALACDIRLMADDAYLLAGYPRIGASPDGGMTWTLSQAIGYEKTMRFLLENKTVTAAEALELGIVGEVVGRAKFAGRLQEYCQQLASISPITARLTKRTVGKATTAIDLESLLRLEISSIVRAFDSEDGREARQAFLEKRATQFKGQ